MKTDIEILKFAKTQLMCNETRYVCYAIRKMGEIDRSYIERCNAIEAWIMEMIQHHNSVEEWLGMGVLDKDLMRQYRMDWLDHLIKICEEEENER